MELVAEVRSVPSGGDVHTTLALVDHRLPAIQEQETLCHGKLRGIVEFQFVMPSGIRDVEEQKTLHGLIGRHKGGQGLQCLQQQISRTSILCRAGEHGIDHVRFHGWRSFAQILHIGHTHVKVFGQGLDEHLLIQRSPIELCPFVAQRHHFVQAGLESRKLEMFLQKTHKVVFLQAAPFGLNLTLQAEVEGEISSCWRLPNLRGRILAD
mmetsp:Transcript_51/g.101  ORF Transcript_51/g.101 Transcript_51/m.101 type:complete len:209 (-) Transcript_51:1012-1638(-)